jgi:hypothetical protein
MAAAAAAAAANFQTPTQRQRGREASTPHSPEDDVEETAAGGAEAALLSVPGMEQFLRELLPPDWNYETPSLKNIRQNPGSFTPEMLQYEAFKLVWNSYFIPMYFLSLLNSESILF